MQVKGLPSTPLPAKASGILCTGHLGYVQGPKNLPQNSQYLVLLLDIFISPLLENLIFISTFLLLTLHHREKAEKNQMLFMFLGCKSKEARGTSGEGIFSPPRSFELRNLSNLFHPM